jgi:hypothetical protein
MVSFRPAWVLSALLACGSTASAASLADMQERTAVIATRYLQVWSSNGPASVAGVPYVYGPTVIFYGQTYTQDRLMAEKRAAIRQWPIRRYSHRPGSMQVLCSMSELKCVARSIIDFVAENPARGTAKRGSAKFDLGISFAGALPRILYEGGSLNIQRARARS